MKLNCRASSLGHFALAPVLAFVLIVSTANAGTILTQWTFENSLPSNAGPHAAEFGIGSARGMHASNATVYTNPVGNGSSESFSSNDWAVGDFYSFETNTLGLAGIELSWSQSRSNFGPSDFELQYSVDFVTFTSVMSYVVDFNVWSSASSSFHPDSVFSADLSAISELNNRANVYFLLRATSDPSASNGTNRVDNFTVRVAPEPNVVILSLAALGGVIGRRLRRSA